MNLRPADQSLAAIWPLIEEDIARIHPEPPTVFPYPAIPESRNPTVARLCRLKQGDVTTVYAAFWPKNILNEAKRHGGEWSARRISHNCWCVERVR